MSAHTPGPLTYCSHGEAIRGPQGQLVAVTWEPRYMGQMPPTHERHANGILLAAAPELLAACEALLLVERKRTGISTNPHELYKQALSLARTAITRATGKG